MWVNRGLVLFNDLSKSALAFSQHSLATACPFILLGFDQITQLAITTLHWSLILLFPLLSHFAKHARSLCVRGRGRKGERVCTWFLECRINLTLSFPLCDPQWVISPLILPCSTNDFKIIYSFSKWVSSFGYICHIKMTRNNFVLSVYLHNKICIGPLKFIRSIHYLYCLSSYGSQGSWIQSLLLLDKRWSTPWTDHQSVWVTVTS